MKRLLENDGWLYLLLPTLAFLIYLNVITEGLDCRWSRWNQTSCGHRGKVNELGKCETNESCEDICNIWAKTKYSKVSSTESSCENAVCACKFINSKGFEEVCTETTCPWV